MLASSAVEVFDAAHMEAPLHWVEEEHPNSWVKHVPPQSVCESEEEIAASVGEAPRLQRAPSVFSAPPVIVRTESSKLKVAAAKKCDGEDGDCLPPDAVVWIEGQSIPAKVGEVGFGQRVLCYDHLAGGLKYAEVVDIAAHDASTAEWVVVKLEDGTELKMTSDHPIYPQANGMVGKHSDSAVKAGDLNPSVHSMEVLRLVSMPVQEVRFIGKSGTDVVKHDLAPSERVSLSVRQPERHSVFVSSGPGGKGSMAVASASIDAQNAAQQKYMVRNTFIDSPDEFEHTSSSRRHRARSAPAAVRFRGRNALLPSASCSVRSVTSSQASGVTYTSSVTSCSSKSGASPRVILGAEGPLDRRNMGKAGQHKPQQWHQAPVKLSQTLTLRRQGLQSVGAMMHEKGQCCPCLMQTLHETGNGFNNEPCRFGLLCSRCHETHDKKDIRDLRSECRRRDRRRAKAVVQ